MTEQCNICKDFYSKELLSVVYIDSKRNKVCNNCRDKKVLKKELIKAIKAVKAVKAVKEPKPEKKKDVVKNNSLICPKCGSRLIYRNGTFGRFIGCTSFPRCHYTRSI